MGPSAIYLNFNSNDAQNRDLNKERVEKSGSRFNGDMPQYAAPYFDNNMKFQFMNLLRLSLS